MCPNVAKFLQVLIRTAPTGHAVQDVIKPDSVFLPEEAVVVAIGQGVGFGEAELRQGCDLIQWKALKALLFVGGDPYVLNDVLSGRLRVFVQGACFVGSSPARTAATPGITVVKAVLLAGHGLFQHIEQERVFRLQSGVLDPQLLLGGVVI